MGRANPQSPTRLKSTRESRGLTQFQLAAAAGLCIQTVSIAERTGHLTDATAARLAAVLGVTVDEVRQ